MRRNEQVKCILGSTVEQQDRATARNLARLKERRRSYDPKCEVLARQFLADEDCPIDILAPKLAQEIQDTIEGFIASENQRSD